MFPFLQEAPMNNLNNPVKIKCSNFGLLLKDKSLDTKGKIKCVIKSKGKIKYNKTFSVDCCLNVKEDNVYRYTRTGTVKYKVKEKNHYFYLNGVDANDNVIDYPTAKGRFFYGSVVTNPSVGNPYYTINYKTNRAPSEIYLDQIAPKYLYSHGLFVVPEHWGKIIKSDYVSFLQADWKEFYCLGGCSSVKKGHYIALACGAKPNTSISVISGKGLLTLKVSRQTKKMAGNAQTNAYTNYVIYEAKKKGTVKVKFTFPNKSTIIRTVKIK